MLSNTALRNTLYQTGPWKACPSPARGLSQLLGERMSTDAHTCTACCHVAYAERAFVCAWSPGWVTPTHFLCQLRHKDVTGNEVVTDWLCSPVSKGLLVLKLCPSVAPNKQTDLFPASAWVMQSRVIMTQNHTQPRRAFRHKGLTRQRPTLPRPPPSQSK